jgi:hypothetical protein
LSIRFANAGTVAGARVENDKRLFAWVDRSAFGRDDLYQSVIHRAGQQPPIEHQLDIKVQQCGASRALCSTQFLPC